MPLGTPEEVQWQIATDLKEAQKFTLFVGNAFGHSAKTEKPKIQPRNVVTIILIIREPLIIVFTTLKLTKKATCLLLLRFEKSPPNS